MKNGEKWGYQENTVLYGIIWIRFCYKPVLILKHRFKSVNEFSLTEDQIFLVFYLLIYLFFKTCHDILSNNALDSVETLLYLYDKNNSRVIRHIFFFW